MKFDKTEKLIVIFVLIIAILLSAIVLVVYTIKSNEPQNEGNKDYTLYQTTAPLNKETEFSQDDIFNNVSGVTETDSENTSENMTQDHDKKPKNKKELVEEYIKALNELKNSKNFTMRMSSAMNIQVNDITGGSVAEKILQSFVNDANKSANYKFVNGIDGSTSETPYSALPPSNSAVTLTDDDVLSAEVISSENGYTVEFVLRDEKVVTNGTPEAHLNCLPKLEMDMSDSALEIENYDVLFSGSTILAKYDNSGRLVYIEHIARSPGMTCEGKAIISLYISMYGNITTAYTISY